MWRRCRHGTSEVRRDSNRTHLVFSTSGLFLGSRAPLVCLPFGRCTWASWVFALFAKHVRWATWQHGNSLLHVPLQGTLCGRIVEASDSKSKLERWSSSKPIRNRVLRVWKASIKKTCFSSILATSSPNFPHHFGDPPTLLIQSCGYKHLSAGDLLREELGNHEKPQERILHGQTSVEMVNLAYWRIEL